MTPAAPEQLVKLFHSDGGVTLKRFRHVAAKLAAVDAALEVRRDRKSCSVWVPKGGPRRGWPANDRQSLIDRARRVFAEALEEPMAPIGRPRGRKTDLSATLNPVRVTPAQLETWKRCGGASWLRQQLDQLGSSQP